MTFKHQSSYLLKTSQQWQSQGGDQVTAATIHKGLRSSIYLRFSERTTVIAIVLLTIYLLLPAVGN